MKLQIYFDYTCPFCFIGERQLQKVIEKFPGIEVEWKPFELHPRPTEQLRYDENAETGKIWSDELVATAAAEGIELGTPFSPVPYTDLAFQGMHFILSKNENPATYNDKIFQAVFEEGRDIGSIEELTNIAVGLGFDGYAFKSVLKEGLLEKTQEASRRDAYFQSGVEALPTFKLDGREISGAVGLETLEKFLANEPIAKAAGVVFDKNGKEEVRDEDKTAVKRKHPLVQEKEEESDEEE